MGWLNNQLLKVGSTGPLVKLMQMALNVGESTLQPLAEDSAFGPKTKARVVEFQGQRNLVQDGVVGQYTAGELQSLVDLIVMINVAMPSDHTAIRKRITNTAESMLAISGWPETSQGLPLPHQVHKISGRNCVGPKIDPSGSRLRQGGEVLANIYISAGGNAVTVAPRCKVITSTMQGLYASGEPTASQRNTHDVGHWCGIFAMSVLRTAGLRTSGFPFKVYGDKPEFRSISPRDVLPGDIGVYEPTDDGANHHFVVVDIDPTSLKIKSIDGNAGAFQTIVRRNYTASTAMTKVKNKKGKEIAYFTLHGIPKKQTAAVVFYTPIWKNVGC